MKFKYYLRGCGLGILIAVVVLMVALHTRGGVITDEKAMKRAAELGMIMPDDTEESTEQITETEESTQAAAPVVEKSTGSGGNSPKTDTEKVDSTEESDSGKKDTRDRNTEKEDSEQKSSEEASDEDAIVKITVKQGEYCRQISQKLYEKGLVADAEEFRKYMQDNDYDNMIFAGTFEFKKGMTYKQIAKILTTKPE